jgi:hypothetical protein
VDFTRSFRDPQPMEAVKSGPRSGIPLGGPGARARARKAKAAQFVSSSFLDWICCCCCITGLPSLGHINCSSLKLRRMESNSTAEPFAMVCSRCAVVRRESRVYGSDVARARAKQSAARLLNSSDWSDMAAPRRVGGGGMASNHHLVLFTHALCQLSYPAVMKRIKPTYCESVSLSETASSRHCRSRGRGPYLVRVILGHRVYQGQSQRNPKGLA